ncbi:MAG: hypothetical protein NC131_17890 [Roseburia sp.]|nr:hypothetical protein [Roseburia sp.]
MSKSTELYALSHSFSGDNVAKSGEDGDSLIYFDFIGSVQSAEADIIEAEERTEQRQAKRKFAQLLVLYFKKILAPVEFKFLVACMRRDRTPCEVGRSLGVDYNAAIASINAKHKANLPKLLQLMRAVGYDYRRGIVLMPELTRYCAVQAHRRNYERTRRAENGDGIRAYFRDYIKRNPEKHRLNVNKWRAANREKVNARARELYDTEKQSERYRNYYYEKRKPQRQANPEKVNAENRKWYALNREKKLAACKAYREAHKDEINARRRAREAAKRLARQQQTAQESAEA